MAAPGFEVEVAPSAGVRALRWAMLALGFAGMLLAVWLAWGHEHGGYLVAFGALMLWVAWRHGQRGLAWGRLRVDDDGQAWWAAAAGGARQADAPAGYLPVSVQRWSGGERLIWIRLRGADGDRHDLLLARSSTGDEQWRQLASWLTWLRRGRAS